MLQQQTDEIDWEFLDLLGLEPGDNLFVHSGLSHWRLSSLQALEVVNKLIERVGPDGTLLMPSYYWQGESGQPPSGLVYDVDRSPSMMGLISEYFRRWPNVLRSEAYLAPVCGLGPLAETLLTGQGEIVHPFGAGSTFRLAYEYDFKVVGLGVSLNTSALAHLPDLELEGRYPCRVFSTEPIRGQVRTIEGELKEVQTLVLEPGVRQLYRPMGVFEASERLSSELKRADVGSAIRFSYPLRLYVDEALRLGRQALAEGNPPPWFINWPG